MPYEVLPEKQYCPDCKQDKPIKEFRKGLNLLTGERDN